MARSKILDVSLPKWPAMTVVGDRVTHEQAAEILIRTNNWFYGCNDREWEQFVWDTIGAKVVTEHGMWPRADFHSLEAAGERLRNIPLSYLNNSRVMSSWIGGAHGWCDWNGNIQTSNYNIGKWPSVNEVAEEWQAIAGAFPFLRLRCQLWSGETCEDGIVPLVEFAVAKGKVRALKPKSPLSQTSGFTHHNFERGCDKQTFQWAVNLVQSTQPRNTAWERLLHEE